MPEFNYKNKDFQDIYYELNEKYPNQPDWFKTLIASLFDRMFLYLDYAVQDSFIPTMISVRNRWNIIKMFNYKLSTYSSASCNVRLQLSNQTSTYITIPKEFLVFRVKSSTGKSLMLSAFQDLSIPPNSTTVEIQLIEGEFKRNVSLGFHNGDKNQEFLLPYFNIDLNHLSVYVNNVLWSRIDDLINSTPSSEHYQVDFRSDNRLFVIFGDGIFGKIPPNDSLITCDFLLTRGTDGNFKPIQNEYEIEYLYDIQYPIISRTGHIFLTELSGGSDVENIYRAAELAIKSLRTVNGAVNEDSIKYLSFKYSSSVYEVKVLPAYFGMYSVGVMIIPYGGGNPGAGLKANLESYLKSKSIMGFSKIRVIDPIYHMIDINVEISMRAGYTFSVFQDCIKFVCALNVCENNGEYLDYYRLRDWNKMFSVANTQFGFVLDDLYRPYLKPVFEYFLKKGRRNFGDPFILNDLVTTLQILSFVNRADVIFPTGNITNVSVAAITKLRYLTVSEM